MTSLYSVGVQKYRIHIIDIVAYFDFFSRKHWLGDDGGKKNDRKITSLCMLKTARASFNSTTSICLHILCTGPEQQQQDILCAPSVCLRVFAPSFFRFETIIRAMFRRGNNNNNNKK